MKTGKLLAYWLVLFATALGIGNAHAINYNFYACSIGAPCTITYPSGQTETISEGSEVLCSLACSKGKDWVSVNVVSGFAFKGWYGFDQSGYDEIDVSKATVPICSNLTITTNEINTAATWGSNLSKVHMVLPKFVPLYTITADVSPADAGTTKGVGQYEAGTAVSLSATANAGYAFKCWQKGADQVSTANPYGFTATETAKYTAVFTGCVYKVTFDKGEGENEPDPSSKFVQYQALYGTLATCSAGTEFEGWFTEKSGGTEVKSNDIVTVMGNHTLYAHWKPVTVVYLDAPQFGNVTLKVDQVTYGGETVPPNTPIHDGWSFKEWSGLPSAHKPIKQNLTCVANGDNNKYTVSYKANGGSGQMNDVQFECWVQTELSPNKFVNTGFTFYGWDTNETAQVKVYDDGEKVQNLAWSGTANLYAVWKPIDYTVRFDANGGSGSYDDMSPVVYTNSFTLPDGKVLSREKKKFAGWMVANDRTSADLSGGATTSIKECVDKYGAKLDGTIITFYANWSSRKVVFDGNRPNDSCEISLSTNEMEVAAGSPYGELATATCNPSFYDANGWWTAADGGELITAESIVPEGDTNIRLYAHWTTNSYFVAFDGNEEDVGEMAVQELKFDTPTELTKNAFTRTGYDFSGWATNSETEVMLEDGATVSNLLATAKNETNTLYAVWGAHKYTVRFYGNGGNNTMADQNFKYGEVKKLSKNCFERDGYSFAGWATDPTNAVKYADGEQVYNLTDVDGGVVALYAKWSGNVAQSDLATAADCVYGFNLSTNEAGWVIKEYEQGEEKVGNNNQYLKIATSVCYLASVDVSGPGTLTFSYKTKIDKDHFNNNSFRFQYYKTEGQLRATDIFAVSNTTEIGWTNYSWRTEEPVYKIRWGLNRPISKGDDYALLDNIIWTPDNPIERSVAITFRSNDGRVSPADVCSNLTCKVGDSIGALPILADREGFKFVGWTTVPNAGTPITAEWIVPTSDTQLYAKWDDGSHPEPQPGDEAEITQARVKDGNFEIGFTSDERFDYLLMTNGNLSVKSWGEKDRIIGDGSATNFTPAIDTAQPCLFYRIDTIQRQ